MTEYWGNWAIILGCITGIFMILTAFLVGMEGTQIRDQRKFHKNVTYHLKHHNYLQERTLQKLTEMKEVLKKRR